MRIAVLLREYDALSLIRYRDSVMEELPSLGATIIPFGDNDPVPRKCDLVWDPGIAGNRKPPKNLQSIDRPLVTTIHGAAPYTVKWHEYFSDPHEAAKVRRENRTTLLEWDVFKVRISAVIAVSRFGAMEVAQVYKMSPNLITPIYHGAAPRVFFMNKSPSPPKPFFLHVSSYQPVKNLLRLIDAYTHFPISTRPELVIVSPGFKKANSVTGLTIIGQPLSAAELAKLYNNALGFIFPSLRESFGIPIVEAMACGCPVITSFDSACAEIAGDAALLINPRSTNDIAQAMSRLINEPDLRDQLSQKGLARSGLFTWAESARAHVTVFRSVLNGN